MTKKSTKRALISSLLVLAMCFTMLAGTTFAWFTDSVTGNNNRIVAGKLQIGAYGGADYNTSITAINDLFIAPDNAQKGLWEPGHVEVAYLKIVNEGTLALKYKVTASTANEVVGKNAAGGDIKLSEILDVAVVESDSAISYSTRDAALAAVTTTSKLGQLSGVSEYSLAVGAEKYVAVIVSMATTVGNEANYRSTDIPSIDFAVSVLATQDTVENDSFDNLYDIAATADATAADATQLAAAIAAADPGDVILLTGDIDTAVAIDKDVTIVGNGNDLKATITGNNNIKLVDVDTNGITVTNFSGTLEFNGGTLVSEHPQGTSDADSAFYYNSSNNVGGTFIFKNMNVSPTQTKGIKIAKAKEVIVDNCTFEPSTLADPNDPAVFNPWARSLSLIDIQEQNGDTEGAMTISITNCEFKNVPNGSLMNDKIGTDTAGAIKIKSEGKGFDSVTISGNTFQNCYRDVVVGVNLNRNGTGWLGGKTPELLQKADNDVTNAMWHISNNTSDGTPDKLLLIAANQGRTQGYGEAVGSEIGGAMVYNTARTNLTLTTDASDDAIAAFNA